MLAVAALVLAAVIMMVGAPLMLSRGAWRMSYPRLALAAWHTTFLGGVLCLAGSLAISVVTAMVQGHGQHAQWLEPTALILFGWVGLAAVGGLLAVVFAHAEPLAHADRRLQTEFTLLAASSTCRQVRGMDVVIVDSAVPIALSVPGPESRIVVSSRLTEALSPVQLRAVIEHERAHLVQHHALISQLAYLNRVCLPVLPAARQLERTTSLLIELIADNAAARQVGAVNTANALLVVGELSNDESMLLRARRLAARPPRRSFTSSKRVRRNLATVTG